MGTTFSKEVLNAAGFSEVDELSVQATPGEIRIKHDSGKLVFDLTVSEAKALADGNLESKAGAAALAKVKRLLQNK